MFLSGDRVYITNLSSIPRHLGVLVWSQEARFCISNTIILERVRTIAKHDGLLAVPTWSDIGSIGILTRIRDTHRSPSAIHPEKNEICNGKPDESAKVPNGEDVVFFDQAFLYVADSSVLHVEPKANQYRLDSPKLFNQESKSNLT